MIHTGDPSAAFETQIIHFHQNFFLGPAAQITGGGVMLVDTLSQYGVGSIYLIAGWFELTAVSNGMLGLLEGILTAAMFAGAFAVLRLAGVDRVLATVTMLVALIVLVYGLLYPVGGLLQHGALRFGLPMALLLAGVSEARRPLRTATPRLAGAIIVGLSSIWALEAFAYTLLTAAGMLAAMSWLQPAGERRRFLGRRVAEIAVSCVVAHLLLAAITLAAAGELPDWGLYLTTLREFLTGPIGDLTYDFSPWSPGVALGAIYLGSAIAVLLVIRRLG